MPAPKQDPQTQAQPQARRVPLGMLMITIGALRAVPDEEMKAALQRHAQCDWGEVDQEDWQANDRSLESDLRLLSAYHTAKGVKFWIITEADRSQTTVLLPEDY